MASECCLSFTKYFLFLFNLIFVLLGSLLLSLGLWIQISENSIFFSPPPYISISLFSYLLITSGSVTMALGFLGCLGSLKTVKCLLAIYFILLTVLLAAQIVGGVLFYTQKTEVTQACRSAVPPSLALGFLYRSSTLQLILFGVKFLISLIDFCYSNVICLKLILETIVPLFSLSKGCSDHIKNWLKENLILIQVVVLAISLVEICGMILSMCLYKQGSVDYNIVFN
ncbi:leukocyte antigen CD37 [Rhinichthys klamathensis goyatoka]|uniref:leukocyte antigen CD37 n=1 Tax=Rhinichthys klamathensis goyatoka TaxID=3034132 RepID=UPI0024B48B38|nr:leukocyte antigen CD37 [Rhinichthys klamathensis goyatoka]